MKIEGITQEQTECEYCNVSTAGLWFTKLEERMYCAPMHAKVSAENFRSKKRSLISKISGVIDKISIYIS